ncbi:ABC transporter permease [Marmoricola sp. URHB0036]|uniref:ABC transporter permease n=1 Tax=Marmoricola sp. URHB0036 TaxID=1298863 RepID=UPI00042391EC|nr:hypothetical protein [Marmoricola sp. URHB0036]
MSTLAMTGRGPGTGLLVRLAVRRDRVLVPVWLGVLLLVDLASAASVPGLYPTEAERVKAAEAINASPGIVALYGPILDVHSTGELAMTKMTVLYAVFVAIMMLFVVRRHTRLDEENGQAELLGGTAVTSEAPLTAALTFGAGVAVLLGILTAVVNTAAGLGFAGSVAFGASWAGIALVAVGLTLVACQLSASSRTCAGIASGAIGVLFVLRAVGDTTEASWLSWLTPFGWNTQLRAYSNTRWWVLLLYAGLAGALVGTARLLRARRDLGAGMLAPRPGPATGSPRLADAIALSLRLHTPMIVGWTIGVAVSGLVFGAITPSFDAFDSGTVQDLLQRIGGPGAFRDTLLGAVISVLALVVTCFAVAVVNHGGSDEHDGRTEQVLATATSRSRAFLATALVALGAVTWLLLVCGVAIALGVGNDTDHSFGRLVASALSQAPAVWTVVALAVLCFAVRSRWALLGWGIVVLFGTLGQIGELLDLPSWVLDLSPYTHVPRMPLEDFELGPAVVLTAIAAALVAVSWQRYRTRDIG